MEHTEAVALGDYRDPDEGATSKMISPGVGLNLVETGVVGWLRVWGIAVANHGEEKGRWGPGLGAEDWVYRRSGNRGV